MRARDAGRLAAVLAIAGALVMCDDPPSASAPRQAARADAGTPGGAARPETNPRSASETCPPFEKPTPSGARVLVDASASLKGFAGKKQLENLHRALEAALANVGAREPFSRCVIGVDVDCAKAPGLIAKYDEASLYRAPDGRLDLALARPPLVDGCLDKANPDPIDARALTIILSDGVQSTSTSSRTQARAVAPDPACAEGPSPACVRALLGRRVEDGAALSIAAAWLPFSGTFYPEVAVTEAMWGEVDAHRLELRVDPRFQGRVDFAMKKPKLPLAATGGFEVSGVRPLVAIVLGHDPTVVRRFIEAWRAELAKLAVVGDGLFEAVEIAPLPPAAARIARVERMASPTADGVLPGRGARDGDAFVQAIVCEETGAAELRASLEGQFAETIGPVRRSLSLVPLGASLPTTIASPFVADGAPPTAFKMSLGCRQLRGVVKPAFALTSTAATAEGPAWWRRYAQGAAVTGMAAPSSWGFPERVHGLDELVTALVTQQAKEPIIVDKLTLVVERR